MHVNITLQIIIEAASVTTTAITCYCRYSNCLYFHSFTNNTTNTPTYTTNITTALWLLSLECYFILVFISMI